MLLQHEFEIDADLDTTWALLKDLERIMPCMPGATLEGREGDEYLGSVKIKVGPIGAHFRGTAHYAQIDENARAAVIAASGKDPKGQAGANARIHARLESVTATRTRATLDTDLEISGRMAQFGRGAIADVGNRIIGQFVTNLSQELSHPAADSGRAPAEAAPVAPSAPSATSASAPTAPRPSVNGNAGGASEPASMDVMALLVPMVKERYGQAIAGAAIGFGLSWIVFGRKVSGK
jgi:carbon monoxide dehydrogenase subunit G